MAAAAPILNIVQSTSAGATGASEPLSLTQVAASLQIVLAARRAERVQELASRGALARAV